MSKPTTDVSGLIGKTPLVALKKLDPQLKANLFAKIESRNPGGSVKDRIALGMIEDAEKSGVLTPGKSVIIEGTSGNTGIALAMLGAERGYRVILAMPESMSIERRKLFAAYGAELVLTPAAEGMNGALEEAKRLAATTANAWMPRQFANMANPSSHFATTGPEIEEALDGHAPDYFVAGSGTGGTISGAGAYLRRVNEDVKLIAVEPQESPIITQLLAGEEIKPASHGIQGIGPNFIPETLNTDILSEVICVSTAEALEMARTVAEVEGLMVGISSGAAIAAAMKVAQRDEAAGKTIVVVCPDTGERYLSTALWSAE